MLFKIYKALLWFLGFSKSEYITYMLKRQSQRLGFFWWLIVFLSQAGFAILVEHYIDRWWFAFAIIGINALMSVLAWHVGVTKNQKL